MSKNSKPGQVQGIKLAKPKALITAQPKMPKALPTTLAKMASMPGPTPRQTPLPKMSKVKPPKLK